MVVLMPSYFIRVMDPNSSLGKICLGENIVKISSDKVEGSGDWDSPKYQDTANSGGKKETKAMVFLKMDTEEVSDRFVASCVVCNTPKYVSQRNGGDGSDDDDEGSGDPWWRGCGGGDGACGGVDVAMVVAVGDDGDGAWGAWFSGSGRSSGEKQFWTWPENSPENFSGGRNPEVGVGRKRWERWRDGVSKVVMEIGRIVVLESRHLLHFGGWFQVFLRSLEKGLKKTRGGRNGISEEDKMLIGNKEDE
ncbi:hypothetical protein Tco_0093804 [Tanacetum coccineum]